MKISALFLATSLGSSFASEQWETKLSWNAGSSKFSLQQVPNKNFKGTTTTALVRAHMKFGKELPIGLRNVFDKSPVLKSRLNSRADGKTASVVALPPAIDSEYVVHVDLGTPPQSLPLKVDTGSSDFWVFSSDTDPGQVQGQVLYYPKNSTTSKDLSRQTWRVNYGDGASVRGTVYTDIVSVGGIAVEKQAVQVAVSVSDIISAENFSSGVLGLASSSGNSVKPDRQQTFLDSAKDDLLQPIFTANLQRGAPGNFNFGYINESEYIGQIKYTPINPLSPFWQIALSGSQIGNEGQFDNTPVTGIVDTGTSLLLMPQKVVDHYYSELPGSYFSKELGVMLYPCELTPPDFIFGVGDYRGVIPGQYINYTVDGETKDCYGGIQSSNGLPFSVFGNVLIKAQFVVFDRGNLQVGFAKKTLLL